MLSRISLRRGTEELTRRLRYLFHRIVIFFCWSAAACALSPVAALAGTVLRQSPRFEKENASRPTGRLGLLEFIYP
jgi:hypothetical protein